MNRGAVRSAGMRHVELLEDDQRPAPAATRTTRRYRWMAAALAVALVGTAVVVQHRSNARADERAARLASVDGILAPLDGHLHARWTLQHPEASVTYGIPADGVLLGGSSSKGEVELHGVDVDTGAVLWRTPVTVPADESLWAWCDPVATSGGELAVCTAGPDGPAEAVGLSGRTMWTVVPRTGEILDSWRVRGDTSVLVTDDQLVMATVSTDGWRVQALDPATAQPSWTFRPPVSHSLADYVQPQLIDDGAGRVLVSLGNHAWLLDHRGRVVLDRATADETWWIALRTGSLLGRAFPPASRSEGYAILPTGDMVPLADQPVQVFPDDGSASDVMLTVDGGARPVLVARSAATGDVLWRRPGTVLAALVLDGRLYLEGASSLASVDIRTGKTRWSRVITEGSDQLSTDGDELVVLEQPAKVTAYAVGDGRPTWSLDVEALLGTGPLASVDLAPGSRAIVARSRDGAVTVLG